MHILVISILSPAKLNCSSGYPPVFSITSKLTRKECQLPNYTQCNIKTDKYQRRKNLSIHSISEKPKIVL